MGKFTAFLLPASDPIFSEPLNRSPPLSVLRKQRLTREAFAAASEADEPETNDTDRDPPQTRNRRR